MPALSRRQILLGLAANSLAGVVGGSAHALGRRVPSRGVNIDNWLTSIDGKGPAPALLGALWRHGFRSLRLPVDPAALTGPGGTALAEKAALAATEVTARGFDVIIDMHPNGPLIDEFDRAPARAASLVEAAWARLAPALAGVAPQKVFLELLNEPPMERADWLLLRDRLVRKIRRICQHNTLVWGAARYQGIWQMPDYPVLADENQIAAVHYYTPMGFTHQCADWSDPVLGDIKGVPFPVRPADPAIRRLRRRLRDDPAALAYLKQEFGVDRTARAIRADFDTLGRWAKSTGCAVVLDEFGVYKACVDARSRANWIRAVRRAAEANGVGWLYWELDQGFGFLTSRQQWQGVDRGVVDALTGRG